MNILRRLFGLRYNYSDPILRQRAVALLIMTWLAFIGWGLVYFGIILPNVLIGAASGASYTFISMTLTPVFLGLVLWWVQRGAARRAAVLLVGFLVTLIAVPSATVTLPFVAIFLIIPVVAAGVLLERRGVALVVIVVTLALIARAFASSFDDEPVDYAPSSIYDEELIVLLVSVIVPGLFLYAFAGSAERIASVSLEGVEQLRAVEGFRSGLSREGDERALLTTALHLVQNRLGYEYARVFLPDAEGKLARLFTSGLGIQNIVLPPSEYSPVDLAVQLDQHIITTPISETRAHLLPSASTAITLPIQDSGVLLGVLDVQTRREVALNNIQIDALRLLADQIGREIVQMRVLAELQRALGERDMLINQFRMRLNEAQTRSQQVTSTTWSRYLQGRGGDGGYGFDLGANEIVSASDLPPAIRAALKNGAIHTEIAGDEQIISVPITLRGEMLGAMSFSVPASRPVSERQLDLLRTVAGRLGVALENNRLFEQSQAQALRERKASEIARELLSLTEVDAVLQVAAEQFNDALGAIYTRVYIESDVLTESIPE